MPTLLSPDPYLTLFARRDCELCKEARQVLAESDIAFELLYVTRKKEGVLWIWRENGEGPIGELTTEQIPAVPALMVRDKTPAAIFTSLEQVIAFAAGRTFMKHVSRPQPQANFRVGSQPEQEVQR